MRGKYSSQLVLLYHTKISMWPQQCGRANGSQSKGRSCAWRIIPLLTLGELLVARQQAWKHHQGQKNLWLTSPPLSCLGCRVWEAAEEELCHLVWGKSCLLELQAGWLCKCGQQTVLCLFTLSCFFVDVSVLRSFFAPCITNCLLFSPSRKGSVNPYVMTKNPAFSLIGTEHDSNLLKRCFGLSFLPS